MGEVITSVSASQRISASEVWTAVFIFFVPAGVLFLSIMMMNHGVMIYTLDYPYIHMKMARNIWAGHYGVNAGEYSAPSSSIIWPVLLAPFSMLGDAFFYAPLVLNIIFSLLTFLLMFDLLKRLNRQFSVLIAIGLFFSLNLYGLVFNGMEHSLQVYLTVLIAAGVIRKEFFGEEKVSNVLYLTIFLLPLVRYEGLAISFPALGYLFMSGERWRVVCCGVAILMALAAFSLFLQSVGLGVLPSSVLSKSDISDLQSLAAHALAQFKLWGWVVFGVLMLCCIYSRRMALVLLLLNVTALHMVFGKSGWYGRYEVYWLAFVSLFFLVACSRYLSGRWMLVVFSCLPVAFTSFVYVTLSTPWASANIYNQQYMMALIASRLNEPLAVNDLGLVSLVTDQYVLDLIGLANYEVLKLGRSESNSLWIGDLMRRHDVKYAFIYDEWFSKRPAYFIKVASLKLVVPNITSAEDSVSLYAVDSVSAVKLRGVLKAFREEEHSNKFEINFSE